jgi:hypothetical protein
MRNWVGLLTRLYVVVGTRSLVQRAEAMAMKEARSDRCVPFTIYQNGNFKL